MKNLVTQFKRLTTKELVHGKRWYQSANEYCLFLADRYGLSHSQVCGIVSALSPGTSWERNKLEAEFLIASNIEGYEIEDLRFTTYGSNVLKAMKIRDGGDPDKLFNPKTGAKTYNFYHNLLEPENKDYICLDRHMIYVATGTYKYVLTPARYKIMAESYRKLANKLGWIPCELQAALWVGVQNDLI